MAKFRTKKLKNLMEKLRRNMTPSVEDGVPSDVKEGHFVVHTVSGSSMQRFVLKLSYLTNPEFLTLLQKAEEEFGFEQEGVLLVPCQSSELQRILGVSHP